MPQIPDYTAVGEQTPTPSIRHIVPDDSGAIIAGGMGTLGRGLEDVGNDIYAHQKADAITAASNQLADFRIQTAAKLDQAKQQADPQSLGAFSTGVLSDFDSRAQDLIGAAIPMARQFVAAGINAERERLGTHAVEWADQQRASYNSQSVLDNLNKLAPQVQADPSMRLNIGGQLLAQVNESGLDPAHRAELSERVSGELAGAAGRGYAEQDPMGTLARLQDPNDTSLAGLNLQQRTTLEQYAKNQVVSQQASALGQVYETNGARAGSQAVAAFESNTAFPAELRDDVRTQVERNLVSLQNQRRQQYVNDITTLQGNIASGRAGPADRAAAWGLYERNALDPSQLTGTLDSIDRAEVRRAGDQEGLAAALDAYTNRKPLDPKDSTAKDSVDSVFGGLTHGVQPGSPEYTNRAVDVATRTGVVPESAVSWARAHLTAGDPATAAQSADLVARLEESNPRALGFAVDEPTKAIADTISRAVGAGTPAQVAVDMARQNATLTKDQTAELAEKWRATKADQGQGGALSSLLRSDSAFKPSVFSSLPDVPLAMQGEFDDSTKRYFDLTRGNLTQARELAAQDLKRVWGVTEVNGQPQIMPYAPEAMYPGLSPQVVREDIASTVQGNSPAFQHLDPVTGKLVSVTPAASDIRIIPTDRTARTNGLEWNLGAPDQFGAMDILRGADGNPLTYRLPVSNTDFNAVRDRMAQASLAKARQLRADRDAAAAVHQVESQADAWGYN